MMPTAIATPPMRGIGCWWIRGRSAFGRSTAPIAWARRTVSGVATSTRTAAATRPHIASPSETSRSMASGNEMALSMPQGSTRAAALPTDRLHGRGRPDVLVEREALGDRRHALGQLGAPGAELGRQRGRDDAPDL